MLDSSPPICGMVCHQPAEGHGLPLGSACFPSTINETVLNAEGNNNQIYMYEYLFIKHAAPKTDSCKWVEVLHFGEHFKQFLPFDY